MIQLQNVSSICGVVFFTVIGNFCSLADFCIVCNTVAVYSSIIGFSTIVSLQTTYICRLSVLDPFSSLIFCSANQTNVSNTVESFPPLNPIIQGLLYRSSSKYWSVNSSTISDI